METKRLLIRNFCLDDAKSCFRSWGQDRELGKYIVLYPMRTLEQMEALVEGLSSNKNAWVITTKENGDTIGYITVDIPYEQLQIGEIGYVMGEKYQGHGYAYEAVKCIINEYLIKQNLYMIEAKYNELNRASAGLLNKLGFHRDGILRDRRIDLTTGERCNMIVCSLQQSEFVEER